jgi:hypothetical protein
MGILHATYGLGALVAPLVSTQFAVAKRWSFHYLTSLCVALLGFVLIVGVFRGRTVTRERRLVSYLFTIQLTSD